MATDNEFCTMLAVVWRFLSTFDGRMNKGVKYCIGLSVVILLLFVLNLFIGSVKILIRDTSPFCWVTEARTRVGGSSSCSRACHKLSRRHCAGGAGGERTDASDRLGQSLWQDLIFGINSGRHSVWHSWCCCWRKRFSDGLSVTGYIAILLAAFIGAMFVTGIIFLFSHWW